MVAYTYILFSNSINRFYTGSCNNVEIRLNRHNEARVPSTKHGVPWKLVWHLKCDSISQARVLELKIKKRGAKRFLNNQKAAQ
ncbi:MAG: GIY-YIG nuclease family protein [Balneolales bacterium]|nr:GIY-YIG nuclease family protein [Balneolales bacterium]